MKVAIFLVVCLVAGVFTSPSAHVAPGLHRILKADGSANIFISFKVGTSKVLDSFANTKFESRSAQLNGVASALQTHAQETQQNVLSYLNRVQASGVKSFWISNQIYVRDANTKLVEFLSTFSEVLQIVEEKIINLEPILDGQVFEKKENRPKAEWGVEIIQAEDAWNMDGGNNGNGIIVANIDTGVRYTHEALQHNFRGEYGWFDPYAMSPTPIDENGHGTHTMGTIAGANGIGVAPGALWMSCRGCQTDGCTEFALVTCGQFMLCPYLPNGDNEDCSKAPHLVNNSWGGGQGESFYNAVIDAWYAAGIVPLFSNGNSGPNCGTANSPADNARAIGVGSTTSSDGMSSFSSKGPSAFGTIKPDVSAPGSNVYSSYNMSDTSYLVASGTSMASPHVAGLVALLKGRNAAITVDEVRSYVTYGNANTTLIQPGQDCGGISEDIFPNNAFGSGRINALNSLLKLHQDSS